MQSSGTQGPDAETLATRQNKALNAWTDALESLLREASLADLEAIKEKTGVKDISLHWLTGEGPATNTYLAWLALRAFENFPSTEKHPFSSAPEAFSGAARGLRFLVCNSKPTQEEEDSGLVKTWAKLNRVGLTSLTQAGVMRGDELLKGSSFTKAEATQYINVVHLSWVLATLMTEDAPAKLKKLASPLSLRLRTEEERKTFGIGFGKAAEPSTINSLWVRESETRGLRPAQ